MPQGEGDPERSEVEQTHGFDGWPGRDGPALARTFLPDHEVLAGLDLDRRVAFPGIRQAFIDHLTGVPGTRLALWVRQYETAAEAHAGLIDVLSVSMAPRLPTCAERGLGGIGDVCFCGPTDPIDTVYFARANVLIRVQSIGETWMPVTDTAAEIDRQIVEQLRR